MRNGSWSIVTQISHHKIKGREHNNNSEEWSEGYQGFKFSTEYGLFSWERDRLAIAGEVERFCHAQTNPPALCAAPFAKGGFSDSPPLKKGG